MQLHQLQLHGLWHRSVVLPQHADVMRNQLCIECLGMREGGNLCLGEQAEVTYICISCSCLYLVALLYELQMTVSSSIWACTFDHVQPAVLFWALCKASILVVTVLHAVQSYCTEIAESLPAVHAKLQTHHTNMCMTSWSCRHCPRRLWLCAAKSWLQLHFG